MSAKGRIVALHRRLNNNTACRWRVVIEGTTYGQAAEVKPQIMDAIYDGANALPGASSIKVTTQRTSPKKRNGKPVAKKAATT